MKNKSVLRKIKNFISLCHYTYVFNVWQPDREAPCESVDEPFAHEKNIGTGAYRVKVYHVIFKKRTSYIYLFAASQFRNKKHFNRDFGVKLITEKDFFAYQLGHREMRQVELVFPPLLRFSQ